MNFLADLDKIVRRAVSEALEGERALQQKTSNAIDKRGLRAEQNEEDEVEEADDSGDEPEKDGQKEKKLRGEPKVKPEEKGGTSDTKTSDETPGTATSKKLKDPSPEELRSPDFKSIAQNINLLRGGKSIKDPEVKSNLKAYIQKLGEEERKEVLVYLNSLAQVMAGTKSGAAAPDPEEAKSIAKTQKSTPAKAADQKPADDAPKKASRSGVIVVGA
jgi:hypothetical protein